MKKIFALMLVLLILFSGCANGGEDTTTAPETETTVPAPAGIYIPGSAVETQTKGELKAYALERNDYYAVASVDDRLILMAGTEKTTLEIYTGADRLPAGEVALPFLLQEGWQCVYNGFAYYDDDNRQAVYLDPAGQEVDRITMPENMQGTPVFAPDGGEIYYCAGEEILAMDTQRGISRLIKSHSCAQQHLLGVYFDGTLLLCQKQDEQGETGYLFVSTEDGHTMSNDGGFLQLDTDQTRFFGIRMDGTTRQYIFGNREGAVQQLNIPEEQVFSAVALGGVVGVSVGEDQTCTLSYYHLETGKKTASVALEGGETPVAVWADRASNCLWILADNGQSQFLLSWDVTVDPVEEETVYSGPLFTAQAPDEAGLKSLQSRVDSLNKTHGVLIRIWNTAIKTNGGHDLKGEYQTSAISGCLDEVERVLERFPENFLYRSANNRIRICIVRSVDGQVGATQYWDDGDAFVVLSVGVDVENELIRAIGYIVDSHVLGNSPMLDDWAGLNPDGFVYGPEAAQNTGYKLYLEGEAQAFADVQCMESMVDERARLFWYAMQPGNEKLFATDAMQAKLQLMCKAIRDAWRLERKTEIYPWEQYLNEPINYVK